MDTSGLKTGLSGIGGVAKAGLGVAAAGFAAVTTAAVGTANAISSSIKATADYGDTVDKMSQKMGVSAEAYQEWDFVMQHCGTSMETMKTSMKTLATAAESGSEAFTQLGLSQEQIAGMSQEELFNATITSLQSVEDETTRTYLAGQLLGRGATELGALLNTSAEETQAMRDQVHDLGGVMSNESVKAAAMFKDSLQNLQTSMAGVKNGLAADLLPAVSETMDGLTQLFSGDDTGEGLEKMQEGIDELVGNIGEMVPQALSIGGSVITQLVQAIVATVPQVLPSLFSVGFQVVSSIGGMIVENLPILTQTALQLLVQFANSLASQLPTLGPTIVQVVVQIAQTLIENLPLLIEAACSLFLGLIEGLIAALPQIIASLPTLIDSIIQALINSIPLLIECGVKLFVALIKNLPAIIVAIVKAVPQIVKSIVTGFLSLLGEIKNVGVKLLTKLKDGLLDKVHSAVDAAKSIGKNIIDGIWKGISGGWNWLKEKVSSIATGLFDTVKGVLGIASPSKKFKWIGEMCVAGFDEGIEDLMSGASFGAAVNSSFATVSANTGIGSGLGRAGQTFNFYDTQTSPDAIRRKVQSTMTFGLAGGI